MKWTNLFCRMYFGLLMLLVAGNLSAQVYDIKFSNFSSKDGMAGNFTNAVLKDRRGNLWVGTWGGIDRFDGAHFYPLKKDSRGTVFNESVVSCLQEDEAGNIWAGTGTGIMCYDPVKNIIKNYSSINMPPGPGIENIVCHGNDYYAGGIPGFLKYDKKLDSFIAIRSDTANKYSITVDRIRINCMMESPDKKGIWVATRSGMNYYDYKTGRFLNYKNQVNSFLFNNHTVRALSVSQKGFIWFADLNLNQVIGFKNNDTTLYRFSLDKWLPNPFIMMTFEDSNNRLWFSNYNGQAAYIDYLKSAEVVPVLHDPSFSYSIKSTGLLDAHQEKDGTIWFATASGLSRCNPSKDFLKFHLISRNNPYLKGDEQYERIIADPLDNTWWMLLSDYRALHYSPVTQKFEQIDFKKAQAGSEGRMPATNVSVGFYGYDVLFSFTNGLWILKRGEKILRPFNPLPAPYNKHGMFNEYVACTGNSIAFKATDSRFLIWYDTVTKVVKRTNASAKDSFLIYRPIAAPDGTVWMLNTVGGLAKAKQTDAFFTPVSLHLSQKKLQSTYVTSYDVDNEGNVWFCLMPDGLYRLNVATNTITTWNDTKEVSSRNISAVAVDKLGRVWSFDLWYLNLFSPKNNSFYKYDLPLSGHNSIFEIFSSKLSNGHIIANIDKDIVEILPEKFILQPYNPGLIISQVSVFDSAILVNDQKELHFGPNDNYITIRFGSLTDQTIMPYSIHYQLEGIDNDWVKATSSNEAIYNRLAPGTYKFRAVMIGANNAWRSSEKQIVLVVSRPFYKSPWFIGLIVITIVTLLYLWYKERLNNQAIIYEVEGKAQLLAKEKTQVQYENLKQHLNPHFLFNSLGSLSSLIELDPKTAGRFLDSLSKTYRYILQSKDKETVTLEEELNFVKTFVALQKTRFEKGLEVDFEIDESCLYRRIVPVTLQNLIENAIKHNIIDEDSVLRIVFTTDNGYLLASNGLQLKKFVETSNKQGLENLRSLYTYLTDRPFTYGVEGEKFVVRIPLL